MSDIIQKYFSDVGKHKLLTKAEEVAEEVSAEPSDEMNLDALKEALTETLAQFSKEQDKKFEDFKAELSKVDEIVKEKEVEVEELKTELNKQPEVEAITPNPENKNETVELKTDSIKGRVLANLAKNVWN